MRKQIIILIILLLPIGCSKKVYLSDKTQTDIRDSTRIENLKTEDKVKDIFISDSSELIIIKYLPPDTMGIQYIKERIEVKKRIKTLQKEKTVIIEKKDTTKVFVKSEKKDILAKENRSVVPYTPLWILLAFIIIINITKFKKWLQ